MSATPSLGRFFAILSITLSLSFLLWGDSAEAQNPLFEMQEAAKTWGMNRIAVLQAAAGDIQGAKHTLSQIDMDENRPAEVVAVSFCAGEPLYHLPTVPVGWGGFDQRGNQCFFQCNRPADHVPATVPSGLPPDYLAPHPRHGRVVDFSDERDAYGTRVTSRRYADGAVVIETL